MFFSTEDGMGRSTIPTELIQKGFSSLSLSPKAVHPISAWLTQAADHLVPNQVTDVFEFQGERENEKFSVSKGFRRTRG
jgi:hypothetical protein